MDIQQGNVVTSTMMLRLRPGMSKSQVRFVMGTPLIQDSFHSNRWDYFYQMRKGGKITEQRRVIMDFENETLKGVRGDVIPAGTGDGGTEEITSTTLVSQPDIPKKGLMDKLKFWEKDKKEPAQTQSAPSDVVTPAAKVPTTKEPTETKEVPSVIAVPLTVAHDPTMPESTSESVLAIESKPETASMPAPEPAPTPAPITEPAKEEEPAPQKEMGVPVVQPMPEPAAEPVAKPEVKAKLQTETKSMPTPVPEKVPVEDEPGYFEYILQKIGF